MNGKRTAPGALTLKTSSFRGQVVQEMPRSATSRLSVDTGFPEPLSPDRNTTLRYPGADTSPNACIEAEDVPLSRTHSRVSSRHSFRLGHRSKSSQNRINEPIDMTAYANYALRNVDNPRTSIESIDEVLLAASSVDTSPKGEVVKGDMGHGRVLSVDGKIAYLGLENIIVEEDNLDKRAETRDSGKSGLGDLRTSSEASFEKLGVEVETAKKRGLLRKIHFGK